MSPETAALAHRLNVIFCALHDSIPGWEPAALADEVAERLIASEAGVFDPDALMTHREALDLRDAAYQQGYRAGSRAANGA